MIKLGVANCETQTNYFSCLSLMDPYCIWDSKAQKCLLIFRTNETREHADSATIMQHINANTHLHQHSINGCPMTDLPVDGGFSEWGPWTDCMSKSGEQCKCRVRTCDSPEPRNGGKNCDEKTSIEILNCQVNGGWTAWSAWSSCKGGPAQSCDYSYAQGLSTQPAIRTRFRTCTNPEPKFNGRVCIGLDQEEEVCTPDMLNPCVNLVNNNQWTNWGAWEACTKNCDGGFQMRRRLCGSKICFGCNQEWRTCNTEPCKKRVEQHLTQWSRLEEDKRSNQFIEQRHKFTCRFDSYLEANNLDGMELNSSAEFRICPTSNPTSCSLLSKFNRNFLKNVNK